MIAYAKKLIKSGCYCANGIVEEGCNISKMSNTFKICLKCLKMPLNPCLKGLKAIKNFKSFKSDIFKHKIPFLKCKNPTLKV